jgi:hypothetical protein
MNSLAIFIGCNTKENIVDLFSELYKNMPESSEPILTVDIISMMEISKIL